MTSQTWDQGRHRDIDYTQNRRAQNTKTETRTQDNNNNNQQSTTIESEYNP